MEICFDEILFRLVSAGSLMKRISSSEPGGIMMTSSSTSSVVAGRTNGKLGPSERLQKIIFELMETERAYVQVQYDLFLAPSFFVIKKSNLCDKDLENLMHMYLEPLSAENYLPSDDLHRLASACSAISRFQKSFFEEIQEAVDSGNCSNSSFSYSTPSHLRVRQI